MDEPDRFFRVELFFNRIGQGNIEFEYLAFTFSIHREFDLIFVDVNIFSYHLENIFLETRQKVGSRRTPPFM